MNSSADSSADWSGLTDAGDGTKGPDARARAEPGRADPGEVSADPWSGSVARPTRAARSGAGGTRAGKNAGVHAASEDPEAQARTIVLRQLTGSAKSRKQLEDKLAAKDIPAAAARAVLDRFEELQLVDDAAFADAWVRSRFRTRGLSRSALRRELREKGIDDELADAALEQVDGDDEFDAARELVERKLRTMPAGLERDTAVRRLAAMLGRKGYGPGVAYRVADQAWGRHRA